MRLFVFYLFHELVLVCEIELSHMGKNRDPDLMCEKLLTIREANVINTIEIKKKNSVK